MAKFILYEGASEDPMRQSMRLVEGESIDAVWEQHRDRGALSVQEFVEKPMLQEPLDEKRLRRGMPVWPA